MNIFALSPRFSATLFVQKKAGSNVYNKLATMREGTLRGSYPTARVLYMGRCAWVFQIPDEDPARTDIWDIAKAGSSKALLVKKDYHPNETRAQRRKFDRILWDFMQQKRGSHITSFSDIFD